MQDVQGSRPLPSPAILAMLAAIISYVVALQSWWVADDWNFLAAVKGTSQSGMSGARLVSQHLYWRIFFPIFGLHAFWWAGLRLVMHAGSAVLVTRIAARCGLDRAAQAVAGLIFATSSLAFTPLYWNCGAEELLGALLSLAAVDRWLGQRRSTALFLGAAAILTKESAFALPVIFAALVHFRREPRQRQAWLIIALLGVLAAVEAYFVYRHFHVVQNSTDYALGSAWQALLNLCLLAWLAVIPLKYQMIETYLTQNSYIIGGLMLTAWIATAIWHYFRGNRFTAACFFAAICSVAAVLPLASHIHSYYAYTAIAPAALTIAAVLAHGHIRNRMIIPVLAVVLTTYAAVAAHYRSQDEAYYLVKSKRISQEASEVIRSLPVKSGDEVIIVRYNNPLHRKINSALSGLVGPRVLLGNDITVRWVDNIRLNEIGPNTHVLVENRYQLRKADLTERGPEGFRAD